MRSDNVLTSGNTNAKKGVTWQERSSASIHSLRRACQTLAQGDQI